MIKHANTGGNIYKITLPVPAYENQGILTSLINLNKNSSVYATTDF